MKEPILVMMAAGMGSRYGGLKQLDPVGPDGEVILDYSLYDAYQAGFRRVVFLIKHEIEDAFKAMVGSRVPAGMEANYAFQQLDKLPEGFSVPEGRVKPWGTGHAVLCCREFLDAPFLVINADDYYGAGAFKTRKATRSTIRWRCLCPAPRPSPGKMWRNSNATAAPSCWRRCLKPASARGHALRSGGNSPAAPSSTAGWI